VHVCCKLCLYGVCRPLYKDKNKNGNASVKGGGDQKQRETAWAATITHINTHAPVKSHVVRCALACAHRNNTLTKLLAREEEHAFVLKRCNFRSATVPTFIEGREFGHWAKVPQLRQQSVVVGPHARQLHRRLTLVSLLHHSLRQGALPPTPTLVWHGVCGYAVSAVLSRKFISSPAAQMAPSARGNNPSATSSFSLARVLSRTSTSTPAPPQPASSARVSIMPCTSRCFLAASLYKQEPA
jgi:hypothetical protein